MNNKCKWDKGEFYPCSEAMGAIPNGEIQWKVFIDGSDEQWVLREFPYCPFCGEDIRKPVEIKVGMFGKFTQEIGSGLTMWGVLSRIEQTPCEGVQYHVSNGYGWDTFTPGLPEGFNQDGTPKENEDE